MKSIYNFFWPDSRIDEIRIQYDVAEIIVWQYEMEKWLTIRCTGFAGITNACIWDDTTIYDLDVRLVTEADNDFLRALYTAYDENFEYGAGRILKNGLLELKIELVNYIPFYIYCQEIYVVEDEVIFKEMTF